jgi:hypothetical protein
MGGGSKGKSGASEDLGDLAKDFARETKGPRRTLIDQMAEALTTGGVGARIPIINRAVESSQRATSNTLKALDAQLAQSGLGGTPFGERIRSEATQQGQFQTSQIGPGIVAQLLQQIPGFITGTNQIAISGLTGQAGAEASQAGAQANFLASIMSPFRFNFG